MEEDAHQEDETMSARAETTAVSSSSRSASGRAPQLAYREAAASVPAPQEHKRAGPPHKCMWLGPQVQEWERVPGG